MFALKFNGIRHPFFSRSHYIPYQGPPYRCYRTAMQDNMDCLYIWPRRNVIELPCALYSLSVKSFVHSFIPSFIDAYYMYKQQSFFKENVSLHIFIENFLRTFFTLNDFYYSQ